MDGLILNEFNHHLSALCFIHILVNIYMCFIDRLASVDSVNLARSIYSTLWIALPSTMRTSFPKLIKISCFKNFCTPIAKSTVTARLFKSFDEIPGPRGPFGLGNLYKYLPIIGDYSWYELHKAGRDKYEKYGSIVRETMVPGEYIVWLYDPNDIATLLNEREYPQRRSHLALEKYRKDRPHIYRSAGLLPTNGSEWWRLRSELQKEISAPKIVRNFLGDVDKITQEFIDDLPLEETFDILPKLARLNLELVCLFTFGERLNSFSPEEHMPNSRSSRLIRAAEVTNSCILPTDQGLQLWRYFETPAYKRLRKAQEYMESVAVDLVSQKLTYFKENDTQDNANRNENNDSCDSGSSSSSKMNILSRSSLIDEYLKNPNLDLCDIVGMAADMLLAGIDTTTYSSGFALYEIAKSNLVQQRLFEEAKGVFETMDSAINSESLRTDITYARATLKEVLRLHPISIGVGRILNKDMVLGGYLVPKGTVVVTQNMISCRLEKYFTDPLRFNPERWLQRKNDVHPYLAIPFGHGIRACIARRLAEQNMLILLLRMARNFEIIWTGSRTTLGVRTLPINVPSEPINILLRKRAKN